jgi:hypothetical protein
VERNSIQDAFLNNVEITPSSNLPFLWQIKNPVIRVFFNKERKKMDFHKYKGGIACR